MPGEVFYPGQHKALPGVYVRVVNVGPAALPQTRQGIVASVLRASWGPLGVAVDVTTIGDAYARFGNWLGADLAAEVLSGGALVCRIVRIGTGGTAASVVLTDDAGSPVNVATVVAKYPGVRPNAAVEAWSVTVRDSLTDATKRELVLYAGASILDTITFPKTSGDEALGLVTAINASGSAWLGTATKTTIGSGKLKAEANKPLAGGADPTTVAGDYATALTLLEKQAFNFVTVDTADPVVHASIKAFVDRLVVSGIYPIGVVGEPPGVNNANFSPNLAHATALNDANMVYVGNGYTLVDGTEHDGYRAAGRIAGLIAASPYTDAITNLPVPGGLKIVGEMTVTQLTQAKQGGMLTLRYNAIGLPVVTQGIDTLVLPAANQDDGWKKIRRVRQRFELIARAVLVSDPLVGRVANDDVGQTLIINAVRGMLGQMVAEGAIRADPPPTVEIDPTLQPFAGPDESYFIIGFVDNDSMEYVYQTFGTSLTAPASAAA